MNLHVVSERGERENEERCERLTTCQKSSIAPMVADLRSARVGRCQASRDRKVSFFYIQGA
ncbi:hypothetical protein MXL52_13225 [Staphylococcus gallinarum]|uniref:hypothetical protein n=1 Tax=Staphylococcus gallinarum TaxID=1293 RepID=UPI002DBF39AF|nr:hypothetical protein [Staphylococcus gallinarum]MEB6238789.1 hypothetical protein [Staphylococcus gallinarum]